MSGMYCIEPNIRCANEELFARFSRVNSGPPGLIEGRVLRSYVLPAKEQPKFGREVTHFSEVRRRFMTSVVREADILATIEKGDLSQSKWNFFLLPDCFAWVYWTGGHKIARWFLFTHPDDIEYGVPPGSLLFQPASASTAA